MSLNPPCQRNFSVGMDISAPFGTALTTGSSSLANASTSHNGAEIDIQVSNVVCSYSLPLHIDLKRVAMNTGNVEFSRNRGFLLKRKRNPACLVKVFSTGKVCIIGCRSEAECRTASRHIARLIQRSMDKLNEVVRIRNFRVNNIFANCKMPFGIKIEEIAQQYPKTNYEPELSVGLVWSLENPKATLRIHTTGSITITGATSEESVVTVIKNIYPVLKQFSCPPRNNSESSAFASRQQLLVSHQQAARMPTYRKRVFPTPMSYNNGTPSMDFYTSKRLRHTGYASLEAGGYGSEVGYRNGVAGRNNATSSGLGPSSSGIYGDKMYFSDEEELYEEFCADDEENFR